MTKQEKLDKLKEILHNALDHNKWRGYRGKYLCLPLPRLKQIVDLIKKD